MDEIDAVVLTLIDVHMTYIPKYNYHDVSRSDELSDNKRSLTRNVCSFVLAVFWTRVDCWRFYVFGGRPREARRRSN